ncbi:MAG: co-chaperone HscB [Motiliproteus sp.]|nr:co-chaperone HscB [Motiliproteus sp.]MCW9053212.1 co-chaperone HscB [Motiliproteus sp.]
MQLEQNFFKLFDLAEDYHLDIHQLSDRYRVLQKETHPDRFAQGSEREQLIAVQYTAHINEALNTLKTPLKRAQYLLKLRGKELCPESSAPMEPMFLMQQMEWRESLEHISKSDDPEAELEALDDEVASTWRQMEKDFIAALSNESELEQAVSTVRKMQFLDKLRHEIEQAEDELLDD